MQTAKIVQTTHPVLQGVLPFKKLVLHHITPESQSIDERTATVHELQHLSHRMPVREVHTHNDPLLDAFDVIERVSEAITKIKPSADKQHKIASLMEALETIFVARLELDDLIDVCCEKLQEQGMNWRELPCMQEHKPTVHDFFY